MFDCLKKKKKIVYTHTYRDLKVGDVFCKSLGESISFYNIVNEISFDRSSPFWQRPYIQYITAIEAEEGGYAHQIDPDEGCFKITDKEVIKKVYNRAKKEIEKQIMLLNGNLEFLKEHGGQDVK